MADSSLMQGWLQRAQRQIMDMHTRLDTVLDRGLGHMQAAERQLDGLSLEPSTHDRVEAFYGGLDAIRDDRVEYGEAQVLAMLNDRLDDLQQDQEPDQDHKRTQDQGMEYA
jgi:hypothetical protein